MKTLMTFSGTDHYLDLEYLQELFETAFDPNEVDSFKDLLKTYISELGRLTSQLADVIQQQNPEQIRHVLHTIKGASVNVGAKQIVQLCTETSTIVKNPPFTQEDLQRQLHLLHETNAQTVRSLTQRFQLNS